MKAAALAKIIGSVLLVTLLMTPALSQETTGPNEKKPHAQLIDDFGPVPECDRIARFDTFLLELHQNPSLSGYVIFYNGRNVLPAYYESSVYEQLFSNHVSFRGFDRKRITVVRGGFRDSVSTQLWVVPPGADPPTPVSSDPMPALPDDWAFKFDQQDLTFVVDYEHPFVLESVRQRELSRVELYLGEETEEFFETTETTADETGEDQFYWFSKEFGGYLSLRPELKGVIIFYADDATYDIAKWTNHIDAAISGFVQDGERITGRVDIIYGGYRSWPEAEFFIVPPGTAYPEPTPEESEVESPDLDY